MFWNNNKTEKGKGEKNLGEAKRKILDAVKRTLNDLLTQHAQDHDEGFIFYEEDEPNIEETLMENNEFDITPSMRSSVFITNLRPRILAVVDFGKELDDIASEIDRAMQKGELLSPLEDGEESAGVIVSRFENQFINSVDPKGIGFPPTGPQS